MKTSRNEEISRELESTRTAYHVLIGELTDDAWNRRSRNPDLLVKELMWHMAWSMGWLSRSVESVRLGRRPAINRLPMSLAEPLRKLSMRWLARRATPEQSAKQYDAGQRDLVSKLGTIKDNEWQLETTRFGQTRTVEWHFRQPALHFLEHAADVRAVLERQA